jgi:ATP-dependent DNA helicase RecG
VPIQTIVKPESRRDDVYRLVRRELAAGRQVYIIYPLVEQSAKVDLKAATEMADTLAHDVFQEFRVGLLHGRMKADAKDRVMKAFTSGDLHVLVATTVVEVGVDVPNASAIVVEHAERFGLSQLHQMRGRVGRGRHASMCFLLYQAPLSDDARARLAAIAETTDGFDLAERDLQLRGPGDFFGTRQAGLPTFRLVNLVRDREVLDVAGEEAGAWLASEDRSPASLERLIEDWRSRFRLVEVG